METGFFGNDLATTLLAVHYIRSKEGSRRALSFAAPVKAQDLWDPGVVCFAEAVLQKRRSFLAWSGKLEHGRRAGIRFYLRDTRTPTPVVYYGHLFILFLIISNLSCLQLFTLSTLSVHIIRAHLGFYRFPPPKELSCSVYSNLSCRICVRKQSNGVRWYTSLVLLVLCVVSYAKSPTTPLSSAIKFQC